MKNSRRVLFSFLIVLFVLTAVDAHADAITNGSFETPTVPVGGFRNFPSGSTLITGWTVVGPQASIVSGSYSPGAGFTFPAQDGNQWLDLTGDVSNTLEGVLQTVSTTAGTNYDLSFWVGNISGSIWGTTSTVGVKVNGVSVASATNSIASPTLTWQRFHVFFSATGSTTTVEFDNLDPSSDNSNGLDNVHLEVTTAPPTPTIPEPSSLLLLGTGLFGLVIFVRHRRS